jgi:pyridoxine kinase
VTAVHDNSKQSAPRKTVIVISSHVARGSVGNRAAVFALEVLGHPVWAIPTVILPFHPGHGKATRIVPDDAEFEALLQDLAEAPWLSEVGAILTGYIANPAQARAIAGFIAKITARNPQIIHAFDPVMGDNGQLYVTEETAVAMREHLLPTARIVTPNRFELTRLSGMPAETLDDAMKAAAAIAGTGSDRIVIATSMPGFMKDGIGNLLWKNGEGRFAETREVANPPKGPGDVMSALFLSHFLQGASLPKALDATTASLVEIIDRAARRGADELMLETDARSIISPMARVTSREMVTASPATREGGRLRVQIKPRT